MQSPITSISIGPGIRGIERGVERVLGRIRELALVEIEAFLIENLVCQMEQGFLDSSLIWTDAKTFPKVAHLFRNFVDILFAGYPCQPFSTSGKRRGTEDPRHLYPFIERTIDIIRPRIIFFENVRGHVTLGLREVIGSLENMGYRVHWDIFSAEETGATHKRERIFILGILEDSNFKSSWVDQKRFYRKTTSTGIELANTGCIRQGGSEYKPKEQQKECAKEFSRSNKLANPNNDGERTQQGEIYRESQETEESEQRQERNEIFRQWSGAESCYTSELANNNEQRLQEPSFREFGSIQQQNESFKRSEFSRVYSKRTVARPGQLQYEWEEPRTLTRKEEIESSLGLSVNGYNFREDFLRALGNSVYEETAELAFITLLEKHEKN